MLEKLSPVAEEQWGLVTRRQAAYAGVSRKTLDRLAAGSVLERVGRGVYRLAGAPEPDHLPLRAAWLQLAPGVPAWQRTPSQGVVSHRSAAALYGLGHLPADRHEFTMEGRKQTRRPDVRLHRLPLDDGEWIKLRGLLVTRPSRTAADLLTDEEDPEAVAQVIADAIRGGYDYPDTFANTLAPHAARRTPRASDCDATTDSRCCGDSSNRWAIPTHLAGWRVLPGEPRSGVWKPCRIPAGTHGSTARARGRVEVDARAAPAAVRV